MVLKFRLIIIGLFITHLIFAQSTKWKAPSTANNIKNPVSSSSEALKSGKKLYNQLCVVCHGITGKGDGIAGVALQPRPANLTIPQFTNQTDGAIYWKITTGNPPMVSYKGLLKDQDIWSIIHYIRSLSKTTVQ